MFEKIVKIGLLFDFYGKLLSDKQYLAIELYYIHDLTLSEVGQQLKISRQGAYDLVKRAEKQLFIYEEKLGLVKKFQDKNDKVKELKLLLDKIKNNTDIQDENSRLINDIYIIIQEILDNDQEGRQ